jgi:hypothetical protein
MLGLNLDDLANFQVLADNPDIDPDSLTPFGEKTIQEQYNEVQTRIIKKIINIVQIIDQPCGSPDMEKKIFAMDPMPGTNVTPLKDTVKLYRCQTVSTEEIKIINIEFEGKMDACTPPPISGGVDIVLVIDTSGSMAGASITSAKASAIQFASRLDPEKDRIGLVSFTGSASSLSDLTNEFDKIVGLISGLAAEGGTAIDAGLNAGDQVLQKSDQ